MIAIAVLVAVAFVPMILEARLSRANERVLRASGAVEPREDVYRVMTWAYPASFLAMLVEGALRGLPPPAVAAAGIAVFASAKTIKYWAIAVLGRRWTFRVLVIPGATLVTAGPYAWLRHPNYVGVVGELVGVGLIAGAAISGPLALAGFGWLLRRRMAIEDRALGRDQPVAKGV